MDRELITKTKISSNKSLIPDCISLSIRMPGPSLRHWALPRNVSMISVTVSPSTWMTRLDFYISFCEKLESQLRSSYSILD